MLPTLPGKSRKRRGKSPRSAAPDQERTFKNMLQSRRSSCAYQLLAQGALGLILKARRGYSSPTCVRHTAPTSVGSHRLILDPLVRYIDGG